jgi:hypothetical protein
MGPVPPNGYRSGAQGGRQGCAPPFDAAGPVPEHPTFEHQVGRPAGQLQGGNQQQQVVAVGGAFHPQLAAIPLQGERRVAAVRGVQSGCDGLGSLFLLRNVGIPQVPLAGDAGVSQGEVEGKTFG